MIISLIGIGSVSASNRVLAARLESSVPGLTVQCLDESECSRARLEPLMARLLDTSPDLVATCCTTWNVGLVEELCRRLARVMPGVLLLLGGAEAASRQGELEAATGSGVAPAGVNATSWLERQITRLTACDPVEDDPRAADPYRGRLGDLARASRAAGPLVVEPIWGGDCRAWTHRHVRPAACEQDPTTAAARLLPLLRAGLVPRLADPALICGPGLVSLLALLQGRGEGLALELPDDVLDHEVEERLRNSGVRQVRVELGGLVSGEVDPVALARSFRRLAAAGVAVQGELTYALPAMDWPGFGLAVDRCVASGVELLLMRRLVAPPQSLPREEAVVHAPSPPHEVLSTSNATAAEVLAMARFARLFEQVSAALAGTGLLRALALQACSVFEIVEGFGDQLAIEGRDVMAGELDGPGRLFSEHLRGLGFDFLPHGGGVRLRRARSLALRWTGDQRRVLVDETTGVSANVGWGAVGLVERFGQARQVDEVCERLVSEAPQERQEKLRRDLHRTVDRLVTMGALRPADATGPVQERDRPVVTLDEFDYHYRMLADQARVNAYREAINREVRPGDHVVEIGTGTGILAVLAARAGARVTAIERYSILDMARSVARRSGVEHLIDFVRGDADAVELDRPGDVLLSEIVGNRILNEGLLESTLDARQRLLRPGARLIPLQIEIHAQLGYSDRFDHLSREFEQIGELHEVDLGPLTAWFDGHLAAGKVVWEQAPYDNHGFESISGVERALALDLGAIDEVGFTATAVTKPLREGRANAVVLSFRLTLLPGIVLSSHDQRSELHWCRPVYMLREPVACRPDRAVRVELRYEAHGEIGVSVS